MTTQGKLILSGIALTLLLVLVWSGTDYNEPGERTVVTHADGTQFVQFGYKWYWAGILSSTQAWPNQISVANIKDNTDPNDIEFKDNMIDMGRDSIMFGLDGSTAKVKQIVQYELPNDERAMLKIHNAHKNPESLVKRRLAPYTKACLQASAQQMSAEMHYSGGRAQMLQDYVDQLRNGAYILSTQEYSVYDSIEKTYRKSYDSRKVLDKNGVPRRMASSIKEYGIGVGDAQLTDIDYENEVDIRLKRKIAAATEASLAKQQLMTAEQKKLTAVAQGQQKLTEIEYLQKQEQTKQVVAAQTQVELAKQDLIKQDIALQASYKEGQKIKTLADAKAYEKAKIMSADGALEKKLDTYLKVQSLWADAYARYTGAIVPQIMNGIPTGSHNAGTDFALTMQMQAQMQLLLDLKAKGK